MAITPVIENAEPVLRAACVERAADSIGGPPPRWRRLGMLVDLRIAELLTSLGLSVSVATARAAIIVVVVLAPVTLVLLGCGAGLFLAALLPSGWSLVAVVTATVPLLASLSLSGVLVAEVAGRQRESVSGHPSIPYFRTLDIPAWMVHLVYAAPRWVMAGGVWTSVGVGLLIAVAVADADMGRWWAIAVATLVLVPVVWTAVTAAASLTVARRPVRPSRVALVVQVLTALVAGGALGVLATRLWHTAAQGHTVSTDPPPVPAGGALWLAVCLAGITVAALVALHAGRLLASRSFLVGLQPRTAMSLPRLSAVPVLRDAAVLWSQRQGTARWAAERRIHVAVMTVTSGLIAARAVGAQRLDSVVLGLGPGAFTVEDPLAVVTAPLVLGAALLGIALGETAVGDLGRHRFGRHLRHRIEMGASRGGVLASWAVALFTPALVPGALGALAAAAMWPPVGVSILPLVVGGVAATVVADHLVPPPRTADGATGEGILTSLLALLLASVGPALFLLAGLGSVSVTVVTVLLTIGAIACLSHRLTSLSA
ncbi:MAG: hypothetical protein Q4G34_01695 [Micrococcus sp.]|nr:hypothetical protein [Micrococcus sp.]